MKDLTQGSVIRHILHMAAFLAMSMLGADALFARGPLLGWAARKRGNRRGRCNGKSDDGGHGVYVSSVVSQVMQACFNLLLLKRELGSKLNFDASSPLVASSASDWVQKEAGRCSRGVDPGTLAIVAGGVEAGC